MPLRCHGDFVKNATSAPYVGEDSVKPRDMQELARVSATETLDVKEGSPQGFVVQDGRRPLPIWLRLLRHTLQLLLPVIVLAGALGIYQYLKSTKPEVPKRVPQETVFAVRTVPVSFKDHQPFLTLYGTTVAGREVELRSLVAGRVAETGPQLQAGGEVNAGDMLIKIDPFDYRNAIAESEAQLAEAKAKLVELSASINVEEGNLASARQQLKLAETDLNRAEPLARQGTVSKRTVDDRRLIALQRRQAVTQSENNLRVWSARHRQQISAIKRSEAALERARKRLAETTLEAPFNAYVTDIGAQVGRMLNVNDRVATLIDRDWIDARVTLTDSQFGRLTAGGERLIGRAVEVRWNAGQKPLVYQAKIQRIDGRVSAESGGVQVYARITDTLRPVAIRPGVFVEVRLADTTFARVAKVSSSAVYDGGTVYVVIDGRLEARAITVAGTSDEELLIAGDLRAGERLLITRLSRPGDGVRVKERSSNDS